MEQTKSEWPTPGEPPLFSGTKLRFTFTINHA
jgi:hypothetical protein